jgi:polyketide cyclase/dehydrase/lipid transport protein
MSADPATQQASVEVLVDLPLAEAWERLQDFSLPHNYVPNITRTEIISEQQNGVGAHRRVYSGERYLEETIVQWHGGEGFVIKLHKGQKPMPPFKLAEFVYALAEQGPKQTRISLSLRFVMPGGGLGRLLGKSAILPIMRKQLVQVAAGIKHFYETGQPATSQDRKRLAGAVTIAPASG